MPTATRTATRPGVLTAALALPLGVRLPSRRRRAAAFPAAAQTLAGTSALAFPGAWLAALEFPAGARTPVSSRRASGFPA